MEICPKKCFPCKLTVRKCRGDVIVPTVGDEKKKFQFARIADMG